jgi:hypothetical protein
MKECFTGHVSTDMTDELAMNSSVCFYEERGAGDITMPLSKMGWSDRLKHRVGYNGDVIHYLGTDIATGHTEVVGTQFVDIVSKAHPVAP